MTREKTNQLKRWTRPSSINTMLLCECTVKIAEDLSCVAQFKLCEHLNYFSIAFIPRKEMFFIGIHQLL